MSKVFISYRRDDSADVTGRIFDKLRASFDREIVVFRDVDNIPLGRDFRKVIAEALMGCEVMLTVIGPSWVDAQNEQGGRRLEDQNDFVRIEIEMALNRKIPVIPLLVSRATMPKDDQLPNSLKTLIFHNALEVRRDPDFHNDMDRLVRALTEMLRRPSVGRSYVATTVVQKTTASEKLPSSAKRKHRIIAKAIDEPTAQKKRIIAKAMGEPSVRSKVSRKFWLIGAVSIALLMILSLVLVKLHNW